MGDRSDARGLDSGPRLDDHDRLISSNVERFARVDLFGALALLLLSAVLNLVVLTGTDVDSGLLWGVSAALACLVLCLGASLRLASSRPLGAIVAISAGHWVVAIVVPIALPFLWPVLVLTVVVPLVLAAPFVPLRVLLVMIAATAAVAAASALIGLRADDAGAIRDIADGVELSVVVGALALVLVPIGLVVWQANRAQQRALDEALDLNRQLVRSRRRVVEASDTARRRIERDLHDGAQQRLVSLAMRLRLLGSQIDRTGHTESGAADPGVAVAGASATDRAETTIDGTAARFDQTVAALVNEAEDALDELRSLAHGVYPPMLASQGLVAALRSLARSSPANISFDDRTGEHGRVDHAVEQALYFVGSEAIANAVKHAGDGEIRVVLDVRTDRGVSRIELMVRDEGPGLDLSNTDPESSSGLTNMVDRIGALGGRLRIDSSSHAGGHGPAGHGAAGSSDLTGSSGSPRSSGVIVGHRAERGTTVTASVPLDVARP